MEASVTDLLLASLCTKHQEMMPPALRRTIIENLRDDAYARPLAHDRGTPQDARKILEQVALKHNVSIWSMKYGGREKWLCAARFEACYRLRRELYLNSYPRIGRVMGGRDHTTILHAIRRHAERIAEQAGAE